MLCNICLTWQPHYITVKTLLHNAHRDSSSLAIAHSSSLLHIRTYVCTYVYVHWWRYSDNVHTYVHAHKQRMHIQCGMFQRAESWITLLAWQQTVATVTSKATLGLSPSHCACMYVYSSESDLACHAWRTASFSGEQKKVNAWCKQEWDWTKEGVL